MGRAAGKIAQTLDAVVGNADSPQPCGPILTRALCMTSDP